MTVIISCFNFFVSTLTLNATSLYLLGSGDRYILEHKASATIGWCGDGD